MKTTISEFSTLKLIPKDDLKDNFYGVAECFEDIKNDLDSVMFASIHTAQSSEKEQGHGGSFGLLPSFMTPVINLPMVCFDNDKNTVTFNAEDFMIFKHEFNHFKHVWIDSGIFKYPLLEKYPAFNKINMTLGMAKETIDKKLRKAMEIECGWRCFQDDMNYCFNKYLKEKDKYIQNLNLINVEFSNQKWLGDEDIKGIAEDDDKINKIIREILVPKSKFKNFTPEKTFYFDKPTKEELSAIGL